MDTAMSKDAPVNIGADSDTATVGPHGWVSKMQGKLHRWAAAGDGRRFDDLFNLVHHPATLMVAFSPLILLRVKPLDRPLFFTAWPMDAPIVVAEIVPTSRIAPSV